MKSELNFAALVRFCGCDTHFKRIQSASRISFGKLRKVNQRLFLHLDVVAAKTLLFVLQGTLQNGDNLRISQRFEFKDHGAGQKGRDNGEKRIMSRRPDQNQKTRLHVRHQNVLLRFVKPVNFIDHKKRRLPGSPFLLLGGADNVPEFLNIARCRIDSFEGEV